MSTRPPTGGVGSNQYQTRGRPTTAATPTRVATFATPGTADPDWAAGMHVGRTPSGRIVATSPVAELASEPGDRGRRFGYRTVAERTDGTWAVAEHTWSQTAGDDGRLRCAQASRWAHTTDPADPNATTDSGDITVTKPAAGLEPAWLAAHAHHDIDRARTHPDLAPDDEWTAHDAATLKCPTCGECLDCNLRACRGGGPHRPPHQP